jgi:hypothetical protein
MSTRGCESASIMRLLDWTARQGPAEADARRTVVQALA